MGHGQRRERDDVERAQTQRLLMDPDQPGGIQPVHHRQAHVHQCHVEGVMTRGSDSIGARTRHRDLASEVFQNGLGHLRAAEVIFDQQDPAPMAVHDVCAP